MTVSCRHTQPHRRAFTEVPKRKPALSCLFIFFFSAYVLIHWLSYFFSDIPHSTSLQATPLLHFLDLNHCYRLEVCYFISCHLEKIQNPSIYPTPNHAVSPLAVQKLVHFWPMLRAKCFSNVFCSCSFRSSCFYFRCLDQRSNAHSDSPTSFHTDSPGFSAGQWSSPLLSETFPCTLPLPVLLYILTPLYSPFWFTPMDPSLTLHLIQYIST